MDKRSLLAAARGDVPADLLLRNGRIVNVFTGLVEQGDIAIWRDRIAGIGPGYKARQEINLDGAYVTPGLIDAHVHIESSLLVPAQFAAAVLPHGVTSIVADPHEIGNVAGVAGIRYMAAACAGLPLSVFLMAPSCVPATAMESTGARLEAEDLALLLEEGIVHGLAEMMNYPGVTCGDPAILAKLEAFRGRPVDGHAPSWLGKALNAYVAAGVGTEHECTSVAEAQEKLSRGLYILIRQATNAQNLRTLLPLVTPLNSRRICFCTDDRVPADLVDEGSIDFMVRQAIEYGIDPVTAIQMATLNVAECYGLMDRGAVAPGRRADLLVCDELRDLRPHQVYAGGQLAAASGRLVPSAAILSVPVPASVGASVNVAWADVDFRIPAQGQFMRVIGSLPDQLVTEERILPVCQMDGLALADAGRDILKMAVVERHHATGHVGLGFIQGIGLTHGAMAGTVAHDHHNLVVIGADDESMRQAAQAVADLGGGLVVVAGGAVQAALPLPVGGLMSDRPIAEVRAGYDALRAAAAALGSPLHDPFMAMSFMALEVIPKLKLTDHGLIDVEQFAPVELFVN
ncbi:MAG: adenine deaminase [Caldilineaceae bacterium]